MTLRHATLITLKHTRQQLQLNYITLHYATLITLHWLQLQLQAQVKLHYITLHYTNSTALHYATLHYTNYNYSYRFNYNYTRLHYRRQHYSTLHYIILHYTHCTTPQLQLQLQLLRYTNYTTLQLQLHYTTTTTTAALQHTASSSCGWGDHCNHCNHSKKHNSNHPSVHQWIRSAIHASQQLASPIVSYLWNFHHRLARYYWYHSTYSTSTYQYYKPRFGMYDDLTWSDMIWHDPLPSAGSHEQI